MQESQQRKQREEEHGMFHTTESTRVVFNCSEKFNGVSPNKSLMSSPDLTNQIVGVITRYKEES